MPAKTLKSALQAFDGRDTQYLHAIEQRFGSLPAYVSNLVGLVSDKEVALSIGSTWLLKAWLDQGGTLSRGETSALIAQLDQVSDWSAQLHLCQSLQHIAVPSADVPMIEAWLEPLLLHKRPFLRAWSLDALCRLALQHEALQIRAHKALNNAGRDRAASVRARARSLEKLLEV